MIVAVTSGRSYDVGIVERDLLIALFDYLRVGEIWIASGTGIGLSVLELSLTMDLQLPAREWWPDPKVVMTDSTAALMERNKYMSESLDDEFRRGTRVAVIAFPGGMITDNFVGHARRRRLPIIDLRSRLHTHPESQP